MEKIIINRNVDFYIAHACNMNCPNCGSFNNYNFRGNFLWKDYEDVYTQWANRVHLNRISILGGEPLANPSILEWIQGVRKLFPNSTMRLTTNGTLIKSTDTKLYNTLLENKTKLQVSLHNRRNKQELLDRLCDWVDEPVITYEINQMNNYEKFVNDHWDSVYKEIRGDDWPEHVVYSEQASLPDWIQSEINEIIGSRFEEIKEKHTLILITDKNNIDITISMEDSFLKSAATYDNDTKSFYFYESDAEQAHEACSFRDCLMFHHGKLYKCHASALFSDFVDQFTTTLTNKQREIIDTVKPASLDMSYSELKETIDVTLANTIPQCSLCPQSKQIGEQFYADIGNKPKVSKNKKTVKY